MSHPPGSSANGTCYTGGSGAFETLLRKVLQCSAINEQGVNHRSLKRGGDVNEHVRRVDDHVHSVEFDEGTKCAYLINSLEESIQFELFSYLDYSNHSRDYKWLTEKLVSVLADAPLTPDHWCNY